MATPEQNPYNTYLGNGVTTEFSIGFTYTNTSSVKVYIKRSGGEEELLQNTDYSFVNATTIKFPASGSTEAILDVGDVMTIQRETTVENDFVFSNQKRLFPEDVMEADDNEMRILQEHARQLGRALVLPPTSQVDPYDVIGQVERVYESIDNVDTVADNIGDVGTVADNMTKINTVSTNIANVNSVATNIDDVNTVAGISSAVSNVSSISSDVSDVASIKTDIQNVNAMSSDIGSLADNETNINTVAGNITEIGSVAQNISNVNSVADNTTNINAVNANKANIDTVAGDKANIDAVAADLDNIDAASSYAASAKQWAIGDPTEPAEGSAKYWAGQAVQGQIQADWAQTDNTKKDFIKNKPGINDLLPSQAGNSGKFLTTNGTSASWATVDALPSQSGQSGKFLTTNGTSASWSIPKTFDLFDHKWSDHLLNDQNWLRADTFSWHPATTQYGTYLEAYNHLVDDYTNGTSQTETVGSYTITYVLATDGHKITTDETTVANIYNESGVAWYYILDTTNQRFKLPRENPNKERIIDTYPVVGNGTAMAVDGPYGASNPSGAWRSLYVPSTSVAMLGAQPLTEINGFNLPADPSHTTTFATTNGAVSIYKGKQYLYFYVGQFSQSATEQTAGLNSELFNGKVDLNAANLSTAGKSLISGLGMPSDTYEDLTLLASGQSYTAPANGYFAIECVGNNTCCLWFVGASGIGSIIYGTGNGWTMQNYIPAKKGDDVVLNYSNITSVNYFRFIYSEGSESEAS